MYRNYQYMELPARRIKRTIEPVDEWLQNEGFYRKHGPKDPTCLFRAIAEQHYYNQRCHIRVRQECTTFMNQNKHVFEEKISMPIDNYLNQMACLTEWGGMNEVLAMSLLYKRNIVLFHGQKLTKETFIDHGYESSFYLCFTPPKQYETVYTKDYTSNAGFCQSIIYQLLYKNVFKMNNIDVTVYKMLHERNNNLRHDKFFLKGNVEIRNQLTLELLNKLEDDEDNEELQLLDKGITPFPYRVAKALDPNIYRNIDYDIWHEIRREVRNSGYTKFNSSVLQIGAKCLVQIDMKEIDKVNNNFPITQKNLDNSKAVAIPKGIEPLFYTGHVQEMSKNQGPVVVFIEELGQKVTMSYENLKPFPQRKVKQNNWAYTSSRRNVINQNKKWKNPWNTGNQRKAKDQVSNDSNTDKNQTSISKAVNQNVMNKSESLENQPAKVQVESYMAYKEYNNNVGPVDNLKNLLENTRLSGETEQTVDDKTSKNNDSNDNSSKKPVAINFNHEMTSLNKQNHQSAGNNDIFYPPCQSNAYHFGPRFLNDPEIVNGDTTKNVDVKGNEVPCSDPATIRHFYNLGVKYFWSQNTWSNGINGQQYPDNSFFMVHPPDQNIHANMMNGYIPNGEIIGSINNCPNNNNIRYNNRSSPPRHREHEGNNGSRSGGQKLNHRNQDFRNSAAYQSSNNDVNKNRNDDRNTNPNDHAQQSNMNKETQRGNKSNSVAPRFKRNYEAGRNRNDCNNGQHQYNRQQYQQDYEMRNNRKQVDAHMMSMGDPAQLQQQQQHHHQQLPNSMKRQQQPAQLPQQQSPPMIQAQTPSPPLSGPYPYAMPYNQVPYLPIGPYPHESEAFSGPYYPAPPGYVQVPYLPASEMPEQPMYPAMDGFSLQYPPVYSPYVYPPPTAIYQNQPPPPPPDGCYSSFPGQPYFFPYPPPPPPPMQPANLATPPTIQNVS